MVSALEHGPVLPDRVADSIRAQVDSEQGGVSLVLALPSRAAVTAAQKSAELARGP